jgi:hypothetical protein
METERDMAAIRAAKKELRKTMKEKLAHADKDNVAAQCMIFIFFTAYSLVLLLRPK